MEIHAITLNKADNVAVVVQEAQKGDIVKTDVGNITAQEAIKLGHKMAVKEIKNGEAVIKYGITIGKASQDITAGNWVHTHNVIDTTEEICNAYAASYRAKVKEAQDK